MKFRTISKMSALALILSLSVTGCRKGLEKTTPLPGHGVARVNPEPPTGPIGGLENDHGVPTTVGQDGPKSAPIAPAFDPTKSTPLNGNLQGWGAAADQ